MAGKRGIEAGRAYVRATMDDSLFHKSLRGMKGALVGFGKALPAIAAGLYIFRQLGNAVQAAANKITEAIDNLAAIDKVRKAFGATAEQASGLFGVFAASGATNARENIESLVTLSGRIKDVLSGTGEESQKLFKGLSVSAAELSKLPIDEQFFRLHEALLELPDPMDRVNRLMLAFGEDGGKTLIGTLSKSTPELREMAKAYGVSSAEMEQATKAQQAMAAMTAAAQRIWQKLAITVAPFIVQAVEGIQKLAAWVGTAIQKFSAIEGPIKAFQTALRDASAGEWAGAWQTAWGNLKVVWLKGTHELLTIWDKLTGSMQIAWAGVTGALKEEWARWVHSAMQIWHPMAEMWDSALQAAGTITKEEQAANNAARANALAKADNAMNDAQGGKEKAKAEEAVRNRNLNRQADRIGEISKAERELSKADEEALRRENMRKSQRGPNLPGGGIWGLGETWKPWDEEKTAGPVKADKAINTAAQLGTQDAADAFLRATQGRGPDDTKELQKEGNKKLGELVKEVKRWDKIVITPGETR
jgi:hypothetical protein